MRSKPSDYPALPFHIIRISAFISSLIVAIILAVFIYHLHADGYKLPYAFLILLIAALLSLVNVILTAFMNCSCGLSTILSMVMNAICLVIWAIGLGLMSYNVAHTILTSCSTQYWGNSTGERVCELYKAVFAFTVLATASYIASIALDGVVRRRQNRFGVYGLAGPAEDNMELKLAGSRNESTSGFAYDSVPQPGHSYGQHGGSFPNTAYSHSQEPARFGEAQQYYDQGHNHSAATGYDPIMHR
ncbi:hypothetical protein N7528_002325 [Penicillium herquei]|nr:hypothetical protein N7528_002325 [Penicillium herquei]